MQPASHHKPVLSSPAAARTPLRDGAAAPAPATPDETLVRQAQAGDQGALTELLTRHQDRIYATCLRLVNGDREQARDLAQDSMVRLIQGLQSFDGRASFTTWMTRVVMNLCLSHLRGQKLRRHASLDAAVVSEGGRPGLHKTPLWAVTADPKTTRSPSSREPDGVGSVEEREQRERLEKALSRLDPDQRAILILRDARDLDYTQIADALGVAVGTVKSRLFRARAALRELLESEESGGAEAVSKRSGHR